MTAWGRGPSRAAPRARPLILALAAVLVAALMAMPAVADFGDFDHPDDVQRPEPGESPRKDTPNDPEYDPCELDDEDRPEGESRPCLSYFNEQFGSFGFNPDSANDPSGEGGRTDYDNCDQLNRQGRRANSQAGDPECSQLAGVRADSAWKYSIGDPETVVAVLDTGIEWENEELVEKVHLNARELPTPQVRESGAPLGGEIDDCEEFDGQGDDANGDGAFNVHDYACDPRVDITAGDEAADGSEGADALLDPSDLIARFSRGTDADRNGYVDDIAGWDFFDDDNDPFDASSCCNAEGHGTGRALEAAAETDNGEATTGMCPECQVMPLRVWDSFVVDTNFYSLGLVYAADNGASVAEGAVGGLLNSQFARRAFSYADRRGLALMLVSSDINSANHNYPTNYDEAVYVAGSLPDSAPSDCGIPEPPGVGFPAGPDDPFFSTACFAFFDSLSDRTGEATPPGTQPPTTSFFRNSNLTQYGGKADIVLMGATGSENTGQAAGAAGLLASYGRQELGKPLTGNEIRQLLTMTAEDVLPANTGQIGVPDRAERGWDTHFGYGRVNLAGAMERIRRERIPPEAQLDAPDWFTPINVDRVGERGVTIRGRAAAPHGAVGSWELEYACGQDARDSTFRPVPVVFGGSGEVDGPLGRLPKSTLEDLARNCDGSVENDPGRPAGRQPDAWPADPYPKPDPERHAFQVRLTVHAVGDRRNVGVYRKTLFAYRDDGNRPGWPKPIGTGSRPDRLITGSGGETPTRLVDLNGDNRLDVLLATSSGELLALDRNGKPLESFNGGEPVTTRPYALARRHDPPGSLALEPREPLRAPAVGDLDGDGEPEIVATAGERVYAWDRHGDPVEGFPARVDRDLSEPCVDGVDKPCFDAEDRAINRQNHIKRGFFGSPALADLDGDGRLDIVAGSLDQHLYAFDEHGDFLSSFNGGEPLKLDDPRATAGAEIVTSPAIANLDEDQRPEVVIATNEVLEGEFDFPDVPTGIMDAIVRGGTGANPVYAVDDDGEELGGEWPAEIGTLAGDILPLVVPSNDAAALDVDGDGIDEVAVSAATGDTKLVEADGSDRQVFTNEAAPSANVADHSMILNLADYPSVGELLPGEGPSVVKGGISLNGVANLLAVNQNLPFNHAVQAWEPSSGLYRAGFPVATDDFQLVSQPAIAKVDDVGAAGASQSAQGVPTPSRHALVGTGLYQLHAYDSAGQEPGGTGEERWPKFLGGWVQPTPAVGDVDGDGKLEVSAVTREGWSFVWDTTADACQEGPGPASITTNQEWWTFGHDEFGSHNYGTDARPPSRPGPLAVTEAGNDLELSFVASGDDLLCGTPERYQARGSDQPIRTGEDFQSAEPLDITAQPMRSGGERQEAVVHGGGDYRFIAIRAVDDAGNVSYVRSASTAGDDGGGPPGDGGEPPDRDGDPPGGAGPPADGGDDPPANHSGGGQGAPAGGGASSGGGGGADPVEAADAESTVGGEGRGALPFTGLGLAVLAAIGLLLLSAGVLVRRRASRP